MKKLLSIRVAILLFAFMTASSRAQNSASDRDHLVGAWKLVALEQPGPDGKMNRIECCGMFVFTRDGHLSVQVMEREPEAPVGVAGAERYSQGGYEASYGSYVVDEKNHRFTFHVEGALVRTLVGKDLPRLFEFSGDQLIVRSALPNEHWRVVWAHY